MCFSTLPTLLCTLAYPKDTAEVWSELARRPSRPISPAAVASKQQPDARRQAEARAAAILMVLGREAVTTRVLSLTCSIFR